jgi:hypothetical protein
MIIPFPVLNRAVFADYTDLPNVHVWYHRGDRCIKQTYTWDQIRLLCAEAFALGTN